MPESNEDEPLNWLAYDANIHDEEGPDVNVGCNLQRNLKKLIFIQYLNI